MRDKTLDRLAIATTFFIVFAIISMFVLLGWGFIEIIQWITSK